MYDLFVFFFCYLIIEFIQQDIKETDLGLPHRCPTTREPVAVAKSQAGFIRFLVMPTWTRLCVYVGGKYGPFWTARLKAQIAYWNESRRLAEFRRSGRAVIALSRLSKISSTEQDDESTTNSSDSNNNSGPPVGKIRASVDTNEIEIRIAQLRSITSQNTTSDEDHIDHRQMIDKRATRSLPKMSVDGKIVEKNQ